MSKRASRRPVRIKSSDTIAVNALERTELWLAASFAPSWFRDALAEGPDPQGDIDAPRREFLFAVLCRELPAGVDSLSSRPPRFQEVLSKAQGGHPQEVEISSPRH